VRACVAPGPVARWEAGDADGREVHLLRADDPSAVEELQRMRAALVRLQGAGAPLVAEGAGPDWFVHAAPVGQPLTRWMARRPDPSSVLSVAAALAEALGGAHAQGCAHGLLGGEDVWVGDAGEVTLLGLRVEEGPAAMAEDSWSLGALLLGALREVEVLDVAGRGAQEAYAAVAEQDPRLAGVLATLLAANPRARSSCAQAAPALRASALGAAAWGRRAPATHAGSAPSPAPVDAPLPGPAALESPVHEPPSPEASAPAAADRVAPPAASPPEPAGDTCVSHVSSETSADAVTPATDAGGPGQEAYTVDVGAAGTPPVLPVPSEPPRRPLVPVRRPLGEGWGPPRVAAAPRATEPVPVSIEDAWFDAPPQPPAAPALEGGVAPAAPLAAAAPLVQEGPGAFEGDVHAPLERRPDALGSLLDAPVSHPATPPRAGPSRYEPFLEALALATFALYLGLGLAALWMHWE
jgi:hypothetical protein